MMTYCFHVKLQHLAQWVLQMVLESTALSSSGNYDPLLWPVVFTEEIVSFYG